MTNIHMAAMVVPIYQRNLQRSVRKATMTLVTLQEQGRIMNLVTPCGAKWVRTFDTPLIHLRFVERTLQRNHISYKKESAI